MLYFSEVGFTKQELLKQPMAKDQFLFCFPQSIVYRYNIKYKTVFMDVVTISDCRQFLKVCAQFLYFILANGQLIVCKTAFSYRLQFVQHLVRKAERKYCWNTGECAVHPGQGMGTVSQNHWDPLFSSLLSPSLLFKGQRVHLSYKSSFPLLFSRSGNVYL